MERELDPEMELGPGPGTELEPELELGPETGLETGTEPELETELEPETELELAMELELDPGNKYSGLHPWYENVVRRKTGQGVDRTLESGAGYYTHWTDIS